jgi:hypothetical protein
MRYRDQADGLLGNTLDWTTFGVWTALVAGICLILLGTIGKQNWLKFWGLLTVFFGVVQLTIGLDTLLTRFS